MQGRYKHLACFIGPDNTKSGWIRGLPDIVYHNVSMEPLCYEERKEIYSNSLFVLGFHEPDQVGEDISDNVLEGMNFGCIVLSDNPADALRTGGIVEYVGSREDMIQRMGELIWDPERVDAKRQAGHEWVRKYVKTSYGISL